MIVAERSYQQNSWPIWRVQTLGQIPIEENHIITIVTSILACRFRARRLDGNKVGFGPQIGGRFAGAALAFAP